MNDKDLLECLQINTALGIEIAIDQYGDAVKTICRTILSGYSLQDIEEAVSDTFVGLWRARNIIELKDGTGLKKYLYGIARNSANNKRRSLAKEQPTQDIYESQEISSKDNVEQTVMIRSEHELVYSLIESMGSPDREIFIYRYFLQHSIKEIADILDLKPKMVENKLSRGRTKLKKQLIQCGVEIA